jgi:hypothetical protein
MSDEMNENGLIVGFYALREFSSAYVAVPRIEMTLMHSSLGYYYAVFVSVYAGALQVETILMCWSRKC